MNIRVSESGSALIEFSLLITLLILMALGVFDFGLAIEQGMVVVNAATNGADFGVSEGNANSVAGMQTAAVNSGKSLGSLLTANATSWCTCTVGSTSAVSCASLCNTYYPPIQYVQVQTAATVPILLRFAGLPLTIPLSASVTMRAR